MSEKKSPEKKSFSPDWLIGGILGKVGEIFDRLTGRNWKPSSSLATSELIVRLKTLLDSDVREIDGKGNFVPHNIKLKMQWNKFSTDSEESLKSLEYELLAAAIDHINDNRYHTLKPLNIEIKPDYFTEGVKFLASFGDFDDEESEINVTVPQMQIGEPLLPNAAAEDGEVFVAEFSLNGSPQVVNLRFPKGKRVNVGRTRENDLSLPDASVSKIHATLTLNEENQLVVADTGSTNGTFINEQRIAYGRAFPIRESDKVKFGTVEVFMRRVPKSTDFQTTKVYETQTVPPANPPVAVPQLNSFQDENLADDLSANHAPRENFDKTLAFENRQEEVAEENNQFTQERVKLNFEKE